MHNRLPVLRMIFTHTVYPPLRMIPDSLRIFFSQRHQRITFAQESAQATIDKAGLMTRSFAALGRFNGLVNQRMGRVGAISVVATQCQCHTKQRVGFGWRRAFSQLLAQGLGAAKPAQRMKTQRLHTRPQLGVHIFQGGRHGLAVPHGHEQGSRTLQLTPEGDLDRVFLHRSHIYRLEQTANLY